MNPTIIIGYRVFAEMRATRLVKDDIKRKGHKWSQYSAAEKKTMIQMYLELHPVAELRRHKQAQAQTLLALGVRQSGDTLVCGRVDGEPKQPASLTHEFTYLVGRLCAASHASASTTFGTATQRSYWRVASIRRWYRSDWAIRQSRSRWTSIPTSRRECRVKLWRSSI